jgi:hypothetical protein
VGKDANSCLRIPQEVRPVRIAAWIDRASEEAQVRGLSLIEQHLVARVVPHRSTSLRSHVGKICWVLHGNISWVEELGGAGRDE